jgi:predicted dehydrogenase
MKNEKIKVAVVGCGIGRSHTSAYASMPDLFELRAVCDIDETRGQKMTSDFHVPLFLPSFDALCDIKELDLIDICTPSYLHLSMALQALGAGKHVVCEKPVAGSMLEVDQLIEAGARSGRRIMPIFQNRFGAGLQKLRILVDQGLTGEAYLATVETHWRRRAAYYAIPWRGKWHTELGGALVTHAIHALDALLTILGPARSVFARTATRVNPIETEDCVSASLEMASGAFVSLSVTLGSAQELSRLRFCFSQLSAESNTRPYENTSEPWVFTGDTPEVAAAIQSVQANYVPLPEGFAGQFYRFYHALHNETELPVTLTQARAALELITAMYASANSGQAITLPIRKNQPWYAHWTQG